MWITYSYNFYDSGVDIIYLMERSESKDISRATVIVFLAACSKSGLTCRKIAAENLLLLDPKDFWLYLIAFPTQFS